MIDKNSIENAPFIAEIGIGMAAIGGAKALDTSSRYGAVNNFVMKNKTNDFSYGEIYNAVDYNSFTNEYTVNEKRLKRGA